MAETKLNFSFVISERKNGRFLYVHEHKQLYTYASNKKKMEDKVFGVCNTYQNVIGIKAMFGNGTLPWNGCLGQPHIIATLRYFNVAEGPVDVGHTSGFTVAVLTGMKNRISGVKISLSKVMTRLNNQATVAAAQQQVTTSQQRTTAQAVQNAYDSGLADGIAQAQAAKHKRQIHNVISL